MKVVGKKSVWEGRFLRSVLVTYSDPCTAGTPSGAKGIIRDWEAVERVNCDGIVSVVPFTGDGAVIVIRQFRPPINGYVVELPAGLCEKGESLEEAANRELVEETGYSADELHFLTEGPLSSGLSSEMLSVFAAPRLSFVGIGKRDETENIEVMKIPLKDLRAELASLQQKGNYVDLKVFGLVEMAKGFLASSAISSLSPSSLQRKGRRPRR